MSQLQINQLLDDRSFYLERDARYLARRFHEEETRSKVGNTTSQDRFDEFVETHNGDKPLLILDVDNTLLYARFFSEEMKIGDIVTYFGDEFVSRDNSKVLKLQLKLHININDCALIDRLGTERTEIPIWIENNDEFQVWTLRLNIQRHIDNDSG